MQAICRELALVNCKIPAVQQERLEAIRPLPASE